GLDECLGAPELRVRSRVRRAELAPGSGCRCPGVPRRQAGRAGRLRPTERSEGPRLALPTTLGSRLVEEGVDSSQVPLDPSGDRSICPADRAVSPGGVGLDATAERERTGGREARFSARPDRERLVDGESCG